MHTGKEDYYEILGVSPEANQEEIKKAYHDWAQIYHPDKYSTSSESVRHCAQEEMKKINEAYDILGDPKKRQKYHSEWLRKKGATTVPSGTYQVPKPKPVVDPPIIRLDNIPAKTVKIRSFIIRNEGGPYSEIWFSDPKSWVKVIKFTSLSDSDQLPLRVEIAVEGEDWGTTYSEVITVRLDNEETQVRIELRTQTAPAGKTTYAGAGSGPWGYVGGTGTVSQPSAPSAPAQAGSRPKIPVLAKWIVSIAFTIVAITVWRNIASISYPTRRSPSANGSPSSQPDVTVTDTKNVSNLSGKWEGKIWGRWSDPVTLFLTQKSFKLYGKIIYGDLEEELSGEIKSDGQIVLKGVKGRRLSGKGTFGLDTFYGTLSNDSYSIVGECVNENGERGKWSVSRASKNPLLKPSEATPFQTESSEAPEKITIDSLTRNILDTDYFVAQSKIFDASFDIVWNAANEYLKKDHVIDISDHNKGILTTKRMISTKQITSSLPSFLRASKKTYQTSHQTSYQTFVLIEKISEDSTKVTVKRFSYNYFRDGWYKPWGRAFGEIDLGGIEREIKKEVKKQEKQGYSVGVEGQSG